ncbi:MAG: type II secretion system F family protein [Mycobacteriales bacterium]
MGLLGVAGLVALFVGLFTAMATIGVLTSERRQVGRSLSAVEAIGNAPRGMLRELDQPFGERVVTPALDRLTSWGRKLSSSGREQDLQHRLDLAGSPAGWDVDRVIAFKFLGLLLGAFLGFFVTLVLGGGLLVTLGTTVLLALLGFYAPNLALYQIAYNRTQRIRRELPDALDLLTISVEAGLAFDAALSQVARNTVGPLAEEFFRVLQEMQIGLGRTEAMRALGERSDLPELRGFVSAMVQADSFGIPIANVLRVQAKEMRIKRTQRAEELAQKVPVKILFPLIFCILPALFIVVIGPAAINIFRNIVR